MLGAQTEAADASARALAANPEIASLDSQIAQADARLRLAKANQVPDLAPEVGLLHDAEPEFAYGWRAALGITLPSITLLVYMARTSPAAAGLLVETTSPVAACQIAPCPLPSAERENSEGAGANTPG